MRIRFWRTTSSRTRFSHFIDMPFQRRDFVELVDLGPLMLVGNIAFDERDRHQALAGAHRNHLVQRRRRVDDGLARRALERDRQIAELDRQLAALVSRRVIDEYRARKVGPDARIPDLNQRRVGVPPVLHARLVAAEQRRRDLFGQGEIHEFARARKGRVHDLNRFGVLRIGVVRLQIVLGHVRRIRYPALDESKLAAQRHEPRDLGRR